MENNTALIDGYVEMFNKIQNELFQQSDENGMETAFFHVSEEDRVFLIQLFGSFERHLRKVSDMFNDKYPYSEEASKESLSYSLKMFCMRYVEDKMNLTDLALVTKNTLEQYDEVDKAKKCIADLTPEKLSGRLKGAEQAIIHIMAGTTYPKDQLKNLNHHRWHYSTAPTEFNRYVKLLSYMEPRMDDQRRIAWIGERANDVYAKIDQLFVDQIRKIEEVENATCQE